MRDTHKNKAYFERFITYQSSRIEKKRTKLQESIGDEAKRQRILVSYVNYEIDLLKAEFSYGADKPRMAELLEDACGVIAEYHNPTKDSLLVVLSLAVMLDERKNTSDVIRAHKDFISQDRLLNCLAEYVSTGRTGWDENIPSAKEDEALGAVFSSGDVRDLRLYLLDWYKNHEGYAWYNSHLGDSETYCGYWSFESAAVAKIMNFNEDELKNCEYYPCWDD